MFSKYLKAKEQPYVAINGEPIDIIAVGSGTITLEQYRQIRANSLGFEILYTKLNNEALIEAVKHNLANCTHVFSPVVYEYTLQNILVPELIKRMEEGVK